MKLKTSLKLGAIIMAIILSGLGTYYTYQLGTSFRKNEIPSPEGFIFATAFTVVAWIIPGFQYGLAAGRWYGLLLGSLYSAIGHTIGAWLCYWLAYAFEGLVLEQLFKRRVVWPEKKSSVRELSIAICLLRQIPFFPLQILSFGPGLLKMPFRKYCWVIALANLPIDIAYATYGMGFRPDIGSVLTLLGLLAVVILLSRWLINSHFERFKNQLPRFEKK